jgi:hypothetical protein
MLLSGATSIKPIIKAGVAKRWERGSDEYDIYDGLPGAIGTGASGTARANMPATACMKSTSTRWKRSGRCCAPGGGNIAATRRKGIALNRLRRA